MLNLLRKRSSLLFFPLLLSGCGSGGETENSVVVDSSVEQKPAEAEPLEMNALVAEANFRFTTKTNVQVKITLNDYQDQRAYVSIYSGYHHLDSGRYYPDSATKIIAGALQKGMFSQAFIGLNNQQQYLVEVWLYDGSEPLQKELLLNNSQLTW
jgi:hypothetical protein